MCYPAKRRQLPANGLGTYMEVTLPLPGFNTKEDLYGKSR